MQSKFVGILSTVMFLAMPHVSHSASVIILDEGMNTDQRWNAESVTEQFQICSSLGTIYQAGEGNDSPIFNYLSLCKNQFPTQTDENGASQYQDEKSYSAFGQTHEFDIFDEDQSGIQRGIHGNQVSDALHSFDTTVVHRPIQVLVSN